MATKESFFTLLFLCCLLQNEAQEMCADADHYRCATSGTCVPTSWTCDGDVDCEDGSDEAPGLCGITTCAVQDMKCKNGRCIPQTWRCNDHDECGDSFDELCDHTCDTSHFRCTDSLGCVPIKWRCDMEADCLDASDEVGCPTTQCVQERKLVCDSSTPQNPECYSKEQKCDGIRQCYDGSDEHGCKPTCNATSEFDCQGDGQKCIPLTAVCDGVNDCGNKLDEVCTPDTCQVLGCQQGCLHNPTIGSHCTCKTGFRLGDDLKSCEDVDECVEGGVCSQVCANTEGGYRCSCLEGYAPPRTDLDSCKATSGEAVLIVANRFDIREFRPKSNSYFQLIGGLGSAVAIDFDRAKNLLYWSDVDRQTINALQLSDSHRVVTRHMQVVVGTVIATPDGIALDWVHGNLYWTDTHHDTIEVINLETRMRKVLIREELEEPRDIVVDPRDEYGGFMYWGDWGEHPRIEKAGMDGSNRQKLVTKGIRWPNGIAIDFTQNRIYWVDAKVDTLSSCDLNGHFQRTISYASSDGNRHAFGIDVFENYIYWTEWEKNAVFVSNKLSGGNATMFLTGLNTPMSVKLVHPLRQLNSTNRCGTDNGGCPVAAICLPSPRWATCQCADNPPIHNETCVSGVVPHPDASTLADDLWTTDVSQADISESSPDNVTHAKHDTSCGRVYRPHTALLLTAVMVVFVRLIYSTDSDMWNTK